MAVLSMRDLPVITWLRSLAGHSYKSSLGWPSRHQVRATLLSCVVLSLALSTLWLAQWFQPQPKDTVAVREVSLAMPPPPPRPPEMVQTIVPTPVSVQVTGAGPALPMIKVEQHIKILKPEMPKIDTRQRQWQALAIDWNALDLNDLDGLPTLLSPLRVNFPKSLSRRGIHRVLVKLDVVIDEQGRVTLVDIIENGHPELVSEIQRLIRDTRFSIPQKDSQPVRARFIWPVEIKS